MHELSPGSAVVDTVRAARRRPQGERGRPPRGRLRQVVPESLEFYWGIVARDTVCEGARLELRARRAVAATTARAGRGRWSRRSSAARPAAAATWRCSRARSSWWSRSRSRRSGMHRTKVKVAEDALDANATIAQANRADFDRAGVTVVNLMSAPGAGKTTLLEARAARGHGRRARRRAGGRRAGQPRRRPAGRTARAGHPAEHRRRLRRRVPPRRQHGPHRAARRCRSTRSTCSSSRTSATSSARPSSGWARTPRRWSARSPRARTSRSSTR